MHKVAPRRDGDREYDDVTLARKVETEIFRPADAPEDGINVNVHHGIVELRGMVKRPEQIRELGAAAERVDGVVEVHNLLHTPGSEPGHSPLRDPGFRSTGAANVMRMAQREDPDWAPTA